MQPENRIVINAVPDDAVFQTFIYKNPRFLSQIVGAIYQTNGDLSDSKTISFSYIVDIDMLPEGEEAFNGLFTLIAEHLRIKSAERSDHLERQGNIIIGNIKFTLSQTVTKMQVEQLLLSISSSISSWHELFVGFRSVNAL